MAVDSKSRKRLTKDISIVYAEFPSMCEYGLCCSGMIPESTPSFVIVWDNDRTMCHLECYTQTWIWSLYRIPSRPSDVKGFESLSNQQKNIISQSLWPCQVNESMSPKLKLSKPVYDMNLSELRRELEKRGIDQYIPGKVWYPLPERDESMIKACIKRLEEYLHDDKCIQMNDLLVKGFCNEIQRDKTLNIPQYLQNIILKYYPPML